MPAKHECRASRPAPRRPAARRRGPLTEAFACLALLAATAAIPAALAAPLAQAAQAAQAARTGAPSDADPWWRSAVIYEIYPRSFQDSNGDGIGDLNGITRRLGYLESLGVDAIWITPFYPSPQVDFGYDISDYEAVDPLYGTLADFDRLLAQARQHHIRIILDMVLITPRTSTPGSSTRHARVTRRAMISTCGATGAASTTHAGRPTTG